jgi:formylglycine-generating enzyme required for sulfatase activity
MGITEVTQGQWTRVMGSNPSRFKDKKRPVENVSYHMAQEFIKRLNRMDNTYVYRLPTEREYVSLVCLAIPDLTVRSEKMGTYAWLKNNADGITNPVGVLSPMPPGFYDLVGNVWEWTDDLVYPNSPTRSFRDTPRICFGGSWRELDMDPQSLKTNYPPDFKHWHLGFRLLAESKRKNQQ